MYVDDIKLEGKTENKKPTWQLLMEDVDLGEQHHFLTMYNWVALYENVKQVRTLWRTNRGMFESRISAGGKENCRPELQGNLMQKQYILCPMTWNVTQRNVWKDIANLHINDSTIKKKSQRHAWMTIN